MKSLLLHPHEAARLQSHGEVLVVRPTPEDVSYVCGHDNEEAWSKDERRIIKLPYSVGQKLWGKERWKPDPSWGQSSVPTKQLLQNKGEIFNEAGFPRDHEKYNRGKWRSASSMPIWASRFRSLIVESIACKMVKDLTEEEAYLVGINKSCWRHGKQKCEIIVNWGTFEFYNPMKALQSLWENYNPKHPFASTWAFMTKVRRG